MIMLSKKVWKNIISILGVIILCGLIYSPAVQSQNWTALPPYNTLWPLWSPALSPVNSLTGLPTPIVTSLTSSTVLPAQPGLTWDPALANPWLLYNTPLGMAYYDPVLGVGLWPPAGFLSAGTPVPLSLPSGYSTLAPTDPAWLTGTIPLPNQLYTTIYPFFGLLTAFPLPASFTIPTGVTIPIPTTLPALPTLPAGLSSTAVVPTLLTPSAILGL